MRTIRIELSDIAFALSAALFFPIAGVAQSAASTARAYPPGPTAPAASATVLGGAPPKVFYACYVTSSGVTYRIKEVDIKQTCASDHVMFSWTDGGTPGPQGPKGDPGIQGPPGPQGEPGVSGFTTIETAVGQEMTLQPNQRLVGQATCPAGTVAISGGYNVSPVVTPPPAPIMIKRLANEWWVELDNNVPGAQQQKFSVTVVCVK